MSIKDDARYCAPPDATPKRPKFKAPPGACDCHIHIIGPADRFEFDPTTTYVCDDQTIDTYLALQDRLGLSRAVIVNASAYGRDNRPMLDALRRYPDRLRGVAVLRDDVCDAELEEMHRLGVRGARFAAIARYPNTAPLNERLAARIAELGWHVQFLFDGYNIPEVAPRLLALKNQIVIDHMGRLPAKEGSDHEAFLALLRMLDTGRVWVKLSNAMRLSSQSGPPYRDVIPFVHALIKRNPDRLVWATDWPHVVFNGSMPNDADLLDEITAWTSDADLQDRILVRNPARLYDFAT